MNTSFPLSPITAAAQTHTTAVSEASFDERLAYTCRHSRYVAQLVAARPEIAEWLVEHDQRPVSAAEMQAYLLGQIQCGNETLEIGRAHV